MSDLFILIKSDLLHFVNHAGYLGEKKSSLYFIDLFKALLDIDFRVVFLYRLSCYFIRNVRWLGILLYYRIKSRYGCDISPYAKIGQGFRLMHAVGIVVGPDVVIGKNCLLFCGVVLGNRRPDKVEFDMPTIGDHVIIGAGSKILGSVKIPSLKLVGANLVLTPSTHIENNKAVIDIILRS